MDRDAYKNVIQNTSEIPVPKYYRLKMDIINKINAGIWTEHEKLPSENVLCDQYGVSRTTVRKTFDELAANHYIYKIQGKGTFVEEASKRQKDIHKEDYGCSEMIRRQGKTPSHKVIKQEIQQADERMAECLNLEIGEDIIVYERVYYSDGLPVIYAKTGISPKYVPGIAEVDLSTTTLSEVLKKKYGLTITRERCVLRAVPADSEMSAALDVPLNFPILYRAVICKASNDTRTFPIEASQLYCRTDSIDIIFK